MLTAPRKITWWIAVVIGFLSAILFAIGNTSASALIALLGLLVLIVATKLKRL